MSALLAAGAAIALLALGPRAAPASAGPTKCPLTPAAGIPPGESWAFTQTGPPSTPHPGIASSYTHGRGSWAHGRGSGTICNEDTLDGHGSHAVVLTVSGASHVSPGITRIGHPGAGLTLHLAVSASDDAACPVGTRGTATLFASYFQGHHDLVRLSFEGACATYDLGFAGPQLHVAIARNGRQVNSA